MPEQANWRKQQRQQLIDARQALSTNTRDVAVKQVHHFLQQFFHDIPAGVVGFYMPIRGEIDCRFVVESLLAQGWRAALPKITARDQPLQFREWRPGCQMQAETWQIPVPQNTDILTPDVLLIPLVGFNKYLHRLGNGGGFYDRTLASIKPPPLAVGVGFEALYCANFQAQPHDMPMSAIVTETHIYT